MKKTSCDIEKKTKDTETSNLYIIIILYEKNAYAEPEIEPGNSQSGCTNFNTETKDNGLIQIQISVGITTSFEFNNIINKIY